MLTIIGILLIIIGIFIEKYVISDASAFRVIVYFVGGVCLLFGLLPLLTLIQ